MTVKSKAIAAGLYGSNARRSYWNGCSTGGNQALSEAQRYPADYDGILAGAPANYLTHLQCKNRPTPRPNPVMERNRGLLSIGIRSA